MLQKILPKSIAMQAYLVTTVVATVLMVVIGYMYAEEKRQHILLSQERKLTEVAIILAQRLNSEGLMARYEQAENAPDEATLQARRDSLQPVVEVVGQQYPGFAMGYSLRDYRLAVYPYRPEVLLPQSLDIEDVYRENQVISLSTNFKSEFWNEPAMRIAYPILKDGKMSGHIWSSIPMSSVNNAVHQSWRDIFFIMFAAWLALMIILNKVFTDLSKTLAEVADKIAQQDDNIDIQKVPQLQPVLTAVTVLRTSL